MSESLLVSILHDEGGAVLQARAGTASVVGRLTADECDRLAALFQAEGLRQRRDRHRVPSPTHYDLLGLARTASANEIQAAFRARAKYIHPDTNAAGSTLAMQQLNHAYAVLGDPEQRHQYDQTLS